ncbi:MAG: HAMP domain-containing sensor histidine kinase [Lachnospiraceae bacterium]|nr:HAMP domain-containing sensor histidine kinase [Lachnospiraceae bacterium]
MLHRLHLQLTFFCTLVTGLILAALSVICLFISESGLKQQNYASFLSNTYTLYQQFEYDSIFSHQRILQLSHSYDVSIRLTDNGTPLFFQQLSEEPELSDLFSQAADTAAAEYGLNIMDGTGLRSLTEHHDFTLRDAKGRTVYASAALIPKSSGYLGAIILHPVTALNARINHQRIFFALVDAVGLFLLFLFSWYFTAKMLQPIENNRRKQTQFIAAASHELRSPLTVMLSCLSAVRNGIAPNPDSYLDTVETEGRRMSCLISDMLLLANADNHTWTMHPCPVELDTLLLQVWESFEPLARSFHLGWDIRLPDDCLPPCVCDGERITQVLSILIDNAFSYTPSGGKIMLSLSYDKASFRICVSDNGPGIPDEQKESVFERFHRLDSSRKDKSHFGLGLSIAKEIMVLHKGSLILEDTPGGGATFRIVLPASCE